MVGAAAGASGPRAPLTIREMLLWLYGLEQDDKTSDKQKLEDYITKELCEEVKKNLTSHTNASASITSVTNKAKRLIQEVCKDAGHIIVCIQKGDKCDDKKKKCEKHNDELNNLKTEISNLKYPDTTSDNGQKLYDQFLYYLSCCYWQLEFLYKICGANSGVGGWEKCTYGKDGPESSDQCKDNKGQPNHDKRCSHCSNNSGCLQAFITATQQNTANNLYKDAIYRGQCPDGANGPGKSPCYIPPMGFDKNKLPPGNEKSGYHSLHSNLNSYFSGHNKSFPKLLGYLKLLELLQGLPRQGSSSITAPKSWVAGDFWAFWYQLNGNKDLKNKLKTEIQKDYKNGFRKNGSKNKDYTDIDKVFSNLLFPRHSTSSQHSSLLSLSDCDGSKSNSDKNNSSNTCGKYLYGLFSDPFHHVLAWFKDSNTIELLTFEVLQTFASGLKEKLETLKNGLQGKAKTKQCVLDSSCRCIVWCDDTHTVLYRHGFTFYSPTSLAVKTNSGGQLREDTNRSKAQKRKCSDLKDQLEKVLDSGSALDEFSKLVKYVPPRKPLTIYEMLLWLHGLTQNGQKQKLETHITTLNGSLTSAFSTASSSITNVTTDAKRLLTQVSTEAGQIIVSIQKGDKYQSKYSTDLNNLKSELNQQPLTYETEEDKLYEQFLYYLSCCFWQLKFLYTVCGVNSAVGGWAACQYGKNLTQCNNHKERCRKCSQDYKGCLQAFLTEMPGTGKHATGNNTYTGAQYNGNCNGNSSCPVPPMGFPQNTLPSSSKQGSDIQTKILKDYIGSNGNSFPKLLGHLKLLELLQASQSTGSSSTLKAPTTWIVSDLWALFLQLKTFWNGNNAGFKNNLKSAIDKEYNDGFTKDSQRQDYKDLNDALSKLLFPGHNNTHPNCLLSLSECDGGKSKTNKDNSTNKCGKYLYSLFFDPFNHVLHWFTEGANINLLTFPVLQTLAEELKKKLDEFKQGLADKECVKNDSCQCIVFCDDTHSYLYQNGFTFNSQLSLAVKRPASSSSSNAERDPTRGSAEERKCKDLKDQLENVTKENSALNEFSKLEKYDPPPPAPKPAEPKPAAAKPVAAKPVAVSVPKPSPKAGKDGRARSDDDSASGSLPSSSTPPARPAATKPATSKPVATTPAQSTSSSAGAAVGGPSSGPVSPGGTDAKPGASSSSGPPAPAPSSPPTSAVASPAAATPAAPTGGGGPGGRSANDSGSLQLQVDSGNQQAVAQVQGPNGPSPPKAQAQASSPSQPDPTTTTPTTVTPSPGTPKTSTTTGPTTGTVHSRDNNKDGVDFWNTFKNSFDKVLKELKNTFTKVSESAIDTAVKATAIAVRELNAHHSSLLEPPCNVKECLEWLHIVCTNGNKDCKCQKRQHGNSCTNCMAQNLSEAVNAILPGIKDNKASGNKTTVLSVVREASALFNAIKGPNYQPAYKLSAQWPTCGTAIGGTNSGVQCRGCKTSQCQCSTGASSSSCNGSCCNRCDVRICAGIFIAVVPALDRALRELKDKLQKESNNYSKSINDSPVKGYFKHLGYEDKDLIDNTWGSVQSKLTFAVSNLGKIKSYIRDAFLPNNRTRSISTVPCYFQAVKGSNNGGQTESSQCAASTDVSPTDPSTTCSTPGTVREMLLWLMGLPYCQNYKEFTEKLKEKSQQEPFNTMLSSTVSSSRKDNNNEYFIHRQYSAVIFQLPVLFFAVEGTVSYLREVFCQFAPEHNKERLKKISLDQSKDCNNHVKSFQYPCDGEQLCTMFYDYTFKVHLQLRFLLTMCDTDRSDGGWKHCKYIAAPAATSGSEAKTGAQDCCSEHNLLCSCPDKKSQLTTTVSNSCKRLLREFLRDCETKDSRKCVNKDPKKCTTHSVTSNAATNNIFQSPCSQLHASMGFRVPECTHTPATSCTLICHYTGDEIRGVLSGLVDEAKGPSFPVRDGTLHKPLSVVTQWMTALQGQEPRSLGDILDLFRELCVGSNRTRNASASALQMRVRNGNNGNVTMASVLLEQLGAMLKDKYADYHSRNRSVTGAAAAQEHFMKIQGALYNVLDVWHHRNTTQRHTAHSSDSDPNLYSLIAIMGGCNSRLSYKCTAYVKSLSYGLYKYYSPEFNTQPNGAMISSDHIIDWLFKWCTELYKGLKELKERIVKRCSCCVEEGKKKDSPECTSIVSCCQCPPELYRCGLVFGDPKTLMGNGPGGKRTPKKCSDFIDSVTNVLSTSAPVFKACEAIMTTVYHVLLTASRNKVYNYIVSLEPDKKGLTPKQLELIEAFHRYVASAMLCSKKKLMETFLKPLCEDYNCQGCGEECQKKDVEVSVSASNVTSISAVIPQYCPTVIDPYHYKALKKGDAQSNGKASDTSATSTYDFQSALDFHVLGANCILPVPSDLRSAVDWILRITVGEANGKNNDNIQHLSDAIKKVFQKDGVAVTDTDVQQYVTALVEGLRTFMGYKDRSKDVIKKVGTEKDSVQEQLKKNIAALNNFIGSEGSAQFGTELGIALQKAMFTVAQNGEKKTLKCVIEELQEKLTEKHTDCELKCTDFKPKYGRARVLRTVLLPDGLSDLCDFFDHLQYFAKEWDSIGENNGGNILQTQKTAAMNAKWNFNDSNGSPSANGHYFTKLYEALKQLGQCASHVQALENKNNGNGVTDSQKYRKKISALITGLEAFNTALNGTNSDKADPVYAVKGAERLIEETKKGVECFITNRFRDGAEAVYGIYYESGTVLISKLIKHLETSVQKRLTTYQSHLDDLKQLCQWLYRMSQLYAHGLKGFVEALVSHLEHIITVIKWIEKLHGHLKVLNASTEAFSMVGAQHAIPAKNIICNLLSSYALKDADSSLKITGDNASTYRTFLRDLRLLALDRYTLQVWQDECNSTSCNIRDWITFKDGIVRHSDLSAIKAALQSLMGITYNNASSSATHSPTHRIHDFHAICVLQKFSYEAPIIRLERSLEKLKRIKEKLSAVKQKCQNGSTTDLSNDPTVTSFCTTVTEFLKDPYGIYSFAKFVHTIMGPNIFSAVIWALEELKDPNKYQNGGNGNLEKIKGILGVMTVGLEGDKDKDHYKLGTICEKLQSFIDTLRREYIFAYPVVCGIESDKDCNAVCPGECDTECDRKCSVPPKEEHDKDASLACSSQSSVTDTDLTPSHTSSLSPMPSLCTHCHVTASICQECIPLLSRIFITLVPVLSPQLCYLAYQCKLYWCARPVRLLSTDKSNRKELSSLLRTFGYDNDILQVSSSGVYFTGTDVWSLLNKETNSLRLLCDNFKKDTDAFPFNTESPLFKLYHLCLQYYQRRRSLSLTDSKSRTPVTPTSLREILRFFVYLPFSSQFDALKCTMERYCTESCVVDFSDLFATLMMSSAMSAVLLQLIECPQGTFLCFFDDIYTNTEGLYLDNNTESLFFQLCDLSVTLYRGLKFLSLQCSAEPSLAGWKDCRLRGTERNTHSKDTEASDTRQLQLCAPHLCECQSIGAKDSSTTCSVLTSATPMCLNSDSSVSTQPSHTTTCSFPLLRYLTDEDCLFDSTLTVQSALRKVCLNDSCQEMVYRHMAPRGWEKEALQCAHRDEQSRDSQLEVCDDKVCYSVCHSRDCDPKACCGVCHSRDCDRKSCDRSKCHPCCRAMCSTLYGHHLFHLLRNIVGHEHDADPLLQFTRYMVAIAAWPPDSLSGYMTFMLRFSDQLREDRNTVNDSVPQNNTSQENSLNSSVLSSLKSEITLFPGEFDPECLIDAFLNVTCCEHNGVASSSSAPPVASPSTDASCTASLSSLCTTSSGVTTSVLRDCKDCKCIIYPLDYEVYDLYLPMYARRYLTWMLHFGPRLHRGMRELEKEFKRHIRESSVAQSGVSATDPGLSDSRTSVQCHASVLQCPFALPELHAAGLHFWDPEKMCSVSCECLVERLHCTLQECSVFADFLHQCDSFLWSVRKPFYWLTMALWIVATVYLLFVHFWRLDSWRLLSHAIRSRASHLVYPKVLLAAEHSYERYYAPR